MDPKFKTSFIPKRTTSAGPKSTATVTIFGIIGYLVFFAALALAVGLFVYQKYVERDIEKMDQTLVAAQAAFEPELIKELLRLDNRINSAKQILNQHTAPTSLLEVLEKDTLKQLRFTDFKYKGVGPDGIEVELHGEAKDFATVALQSDVFSKEPSFQNPIFSDVNVSRSDKGSDSVTFTFQTKIRTDSILYRNLITELAQPPVTQTGTTTTESTTNNAN